MRLSRSITSRICGLSPMTPSKPNFSSSRRFSSTFVRRSRELSAAFSATGPKLGEVERLEQVVERPLLHRLDGRGDRAVAGHEDHFGVGLVGLRPGEDAQAVDVVHHQIGDDDVEGRLLDQLRPFGAGGGHAAVEAHPLEALGHGLGVGWSLSTISTSAGGPAWFSAAAGASFGDFISLACLAAESLIGRMIPQRRRPD